MAADGSRAGTIGVSLELRGCCRLCRDSDADPLSGPDWPGEHGAREPNPCRDQENQRRAAARNAGRAAGVGQQAEQGHVRHELGDLRRFVRAVVAAGQATSDPQRRAGQGRRQHLGLLRHRRWRQGRAPRVGARRRTGRQSTAGCRLRARARRPSGRKSRMVPTACDQPSCRTGHQALARITPGSEVYETGLLVQGDPQDTTR